MNKETLNQKEQKQIECAAEKLAQIFVEQALLRSRGRNSQSKKIKTGKTICQSTKKF